MVFLPILIGSLFFFDDEFTQLVAGSKRNFLLLRRLALTLESIDTPTDTGCASYKHDDHHPDHGGSQSHGGILS